MQIFLMIMQLLPSILEMIKKIEEINSKTGLGPVKGKALEEMAVAAAGGDTAVVKPLNKVVSIMVKLLKDIAPPAAPEGVVK